MSQLYLVPMKRLLALLTLVLFLASPAGAALDASKNFAKSTLSTGYTSAATSIVLTAGGGAKFPTPPFNAVWWDASDYGDPSDDPSVEIVRVTVISTDTLTVTRAQESTSAANHNTAGKVYLLVAGPTAKLTTDILTIDTSGTAAISTAATITNDATTAATMYPVWVTANTGNLPVKTSSTKLSFRPDTGIFTATGFAGPLTGNVTGNASGSAGTATSIASHASTELSDTANVARLNAMNTITGNTNTFEQGITVNKDNGVFSKTFDVVSNSPSFSTIQTHAGGGGTGFVNTMGLKIDNRGNNDSIHIVNNTTDILTVQAGGFTGIGTAGPHDVLELGSGNVLVANNSFYKGWTASNTAQWRIIGTNSSNQTSISPEEQGTIFGAGNVGLGTTTWGTSAATVLGIGNGTAPTSSPSGMVQLWSEVVSSTQELRVRDGAGNVTTLSPHNFSMFTPNASQIFPWSYYSKNAHIGKEMSVDMYGLAAAVEKLTGQKFIYVADLPADQIESWDAQEATNKTTIEKQRLDKALEKEVEVVVADAVEVVAVTQERPSATLMVSVTRFGLNATSGILESVVETRPATEMFDTGKTESRLKVGVRLDEKTGKFWRKVRADEVTIEPYVPKAPPAWIADRMAKK